jgi:hypothetical protein
MHNWRILNSQKHTTKGTRRRKAHTKGAKHCYHAFSRFWIVAAMEGDVYRLLSTTGKTITIPYERPE